MGTNRPLSYYQIFSKFRSKSSDSLPAIPRKNEPVKKMNKSPTILHRRLSFFRLKRSSPSNVQALEEVIDQLKSDLQSKTDELQSIREHQRTPSTTANQSIEQAMQLQSKLNAKLEEMFIENDLLKKSIEEIESFAQQQKKLRSAIVQ